MKKILAIFYSLTLIFVLPKTVFANQYTEVIEGRVVGSPVDNYLLVEIKSGQEKKTVPVFIEDGLFAEQIKLKVGSKVMISPISETEDTYYLADIVRRQSLIPLLILFLALVLLVGGWRGVGSLFGLIASLLVVALLVVPLIADGNNPVLVVLLGSFIIVPLTFYFSHGFSKKTTIAIVGTVIALAFSGFLAQGAIQATQLTGLVSEEAGFLQSANPGAYNLTGILLAGIIIGLLGVLDDVTVSQAAIVSELLAVDKDISDKELFLRAMSIGKDHVSSMVNTLILVYTGVSLPLLLLFHSNPRPLLQVVNYEVFTEEIVRALIGSIGLILAIPLTTILAIKWSR